MRRRKTLTAVLAAPSERRAEKVIASYKSVLPFDRYCLMKHKHCLSGDRSSCIFMIVQALHAVGANPSEIAAVVWNSPYFASKHGRRLDHLNADSHESSPSWGMQ